MARKDFIGHGVEKINIEDYGRGRKGNIDYERLRQSKKNGFIYLRREVLGKVPLYELDFLNKIRVVLDYINESTGRSARKLEAMRAKEADRLSALEIVASNFITDKVEERFNNRTNKVGFQLDAKFGEVTPQLAHKCIKGNMNLEVLEVNPNYIKYCRDIPVVATVTTDKKDSI